MKQAIQPYLHFSDNCKDAMTFYHSIFGGDLEMMHVSESSEKERFPEEVQDQILHASLHNGDFRLMASDMCGQEVLKQGNSLQLSLDCRKEEEIKRLYQQLPEGGRVISDLQEEFWGGLFAMVIDKFGVRWMLSLNK